MKTLKILDWPAQRFYSETHPLHRWKDELLEHGIKVEFYTDHRSRKLRDADYLLIHSRYFENGWQNVQKRTAENETDLISFLTEIRRTVGWLIWFDASDSSGSADFGIIEFVDSFLKKQLLKDLKYYTSNGYNSGDYDLLDSVPDQHVSTGIPSKYMLNQERKDIRIWLNESKRTREITKFRPCQRSQLYKLKLAWNIGFNDYRQFGYKLSRLSNYLSYHSYELRFSDVNQPRMLDLAFRGTIHYGDDPANAVSYQRRKILQLLSQTKLNVITGSRVSKSQYWKEMRNSKLSISPFGWGEVCYRDFETFIAGSILIKPSVTHLNTYPDLFIPQETYIPVRWDLSDLSEKLVHIADNYSAYKYIAANAQELYKKTINDSESFISNLKTLIH